MSDTPNRMVIERVQWLDVLPILRLGSAFRHALQPGKLIVALIAVLAIHLSGTILDALWADGEEGIEGDDYFEYAGQIESGVYNQLVAAEGQAFSRLQSEALSLDVLGVFSALKSMAFDIPATFISQHPWYMLLFGADALFVLMMASGIMCRMSATQVCQGKLTSLNRSVKFVGKRWPWYVLTPLLPAGFAVLLGLVLMLAGLVFFNLPVLDVVGALLYGLLLLLGFLIVAIGFVLLFALFLMPPAMSVEGTDAFDAISRAFNYVLYKPWQFAGYLAGAVFYLAVVYLIVSLLAGFTVYATYEAVDVGAFADSDISGITRHEAIAGQYEIQDNPGGTAVVSSWIVSRWLELVGAIVIALMFSTLCSLQTQVYVLIRRSADDTPLDECAADDEVDPWSSPQDMVDPAAQAIAASGPKGHPTPEDGGGAQADKPAESSEPEPKEGDA